MYILKEKKESKEYCTGRILNKTKKVYVSQSTRINDSCGKTNMCAEYKETKREERENKQTKETLCRTKHKN